MELAIEYVPSVPSLSDQPHCFASLPPSVVASLNQLTPFSPLTVLRLQPLTSQSRYIYIAWTASVSPKPATLGLHPRFADSLSLSPGSLVTVKVVERLSHSATPLYPLCTSTLRPLSYDRSQSHQTTSNGQDNSAYTAASDFHTLSTGASTLQHTLLTQVRVVYPGLVFPLTLPASETISMRVISIGTTNSTSTSPYALVQPDAEILIEPPPQQPASKTKPLRAFLRATPLPLSQFSTLSEAHVLTHAFLPPLATSSNIFQTQLTVLLSRKLSKTDLPVSVPAIPLTARRHEAVPPRTIVLPPFAWHFLRLTPLTPVLVEQIPSPSPTELPSKLELHLHAAHPSIQPLFPTFSDIMKAGAVYFDGIPLQEGYLLTESSEATESEEIIDLWDNPAWPSQKSPSSDDPVHEFNSLEDDERESLNGSFAASMSKRLVLRAHFPLSNQEPTRISKSVSFPLTSEPTDISVPLFPSYEHTLRASLLNELTPSCVKIVDDVIRTACHSLSHRGIPNGALTARSRKATIIVVEGPVGTGKTHICETASAVLRSNAQVRTCWIRGLVHATENQKVTRRRLKAAYHAATDGGPGLVVIDDIDILCASRKDGGDSSLDVSPDPTHSDDNGELTTEIAKGIDVANAITEIAQKSSGFSCVFLLTCEKVADLQSALRVPGLITSIASLPELSEEDRAFLFFNALNNSIFLKNDDTEHGEIPGHESDLAILSEEASSLARITEGYCARDVDVCLRRAGLSHHMPAHGGTKNTIGDEGLKSISGTLRDVIDDMIPLSRAGLKARSEDSDSKDLKWDKLGGINTVREVIEDTLQLPSMHPEVFQNVPIQLAHGLLLYGPPGCGKTTIAKTAAKECGLSCVVVKGPELMSKYIGESEAQVRRAFSRAASSRPCVLLFDEFDALAPQRGGGPGHGATGVADRVVNTLLTCLDGVERLANGVFIVATTSRPEVIDPALLRPGRLDRWVGVDLPKSIEQREDILYRLASEAFEVTGSEREKLMEIAKHTEGYSGADLGAIINDAEIRLITLEKDSTKWTSDLVVDSLEKAKAESRPSVSESRRRYHASIMEQFGGKRDNVVRPEDFGTKLALQ